MNIYEEKFVKNLFDRMSETYGLTNYISSFGFTERWRKQCVGEIDWGFEISKGFDLMSGMGESWGLINQACGQMHELVGVDISPAMNEKAKEGANKHNYLKIKICEENVLQNTIDDNSADYIVSTFGLKTFSDSQLKVLARQIRRILKPNGQFSFVEISKPKSMFLVIPYMFYLKFAIPVIGKIFMGDSLDYRMLGVYCEAFKDCTKFKSYLEEEGLLVNMNTYFFGCATGVYGKKADVRPSE
jgi:demethylmenaquinone methyltransferase/2-methoxy-6-polyprenyl-1,4-benzoquinol methylase